MQTAYTNRYGDYILYIINKSGRKYGKKITKYSIKYTNYRKRKFGSTFLHQIFFYTKNFLHQFFAFLHFFVIKIKKK